MEDRNHDSTDQQLVCVSTFNPISNQVTKIVNKHRRTLNSIQLTLLKPIFAHKRGRNLRDLLVHTLPKPATPVSNTLPFLPPVKGHFACGNCSVCPLTTTTKNITFENGLQWEIRSHTNCNTPKVVYVITCPCKLLNIGMMTHKVKLRIGEHRSNIRCKKNNTRMTTHFLEKVPFADRSEDLLLGKECRL
mgnify:CR=1 FL=1